MMKKLLSFLMIFVLLSALMVPTSASVYAEDTLLVDRLDLFSDAEETALLSRIVSFIEKRDCHMLIVTDTVRYSNDYVIRDVIDGLRSTDLIVLTVSLEGGVYYYDLFTYGKAYEKISSSDVNAILDADTVYDNIKGGNVYEGVLAFIDMADARMGVFCFKAEQIPGILLVSLIAAIIACVVVVARYKMKIKPTNYPLDRFAKLSLTEEKDIFTGSFVTKHRVSSSSSGGGGRSGDGGGRSGGHRGGR